MSELLQRLGFVPWVDYFRQLPIQVGPRHTYILDFAFPAAKLCIEVDGDGHRTQKHRQHDAERDARLASKGWTTLRFSPREIHRQPERVAKIIAEHLTGTFTFVV